jgi:2-isopropylmalate synthase
VVQARTDSGGGEISSENLWKVFTDEYLPSQGDDGRWGKYRLDSINIDSKDNGDTFLKVGLIIDGKRGERTGRGNGPIDAMQNILSAEGIDVRLLDYSEHTLAASSNAQAASFIEAAVGSRVLWGIGIDNSTTRASLKAMVSAVNRALRDSEIA